MCYIIMLGNCACCGSPFTFNPHLVPSVRVKGTRRPICQFCVREANKLREAKKLEPIKILDGAYAPMPEEEL